MRRYWIEKHEIHNGEIHLSGDLFHHIFDVCRQEVGSKFELLTEESKAYFVEVTQLTKKTAFIRILEERVIAPLKDPKIHLALSIPRFPVMEAVIEKAVELGVASIHPFFSDYSFIKKDEKISPNKIERWEKIIRSATQQSGRGDLLKLNPALSFEKILESINRDEGTVGLFAYEGVSTLSIKDYVSQAKAKHPQGLKNIWIIVGSEGGFSTQEVTHLTKLGLDPVTLGPQVLRVETACMTLVSVLKYDFDLMC